MSEAMNARQGGVRLRLLTTVSSIALLASVYGTQPAIAQPGSEPALWVEAGLQSNKVSKAADNFALPFDSGVPPNGLTGPLTEALHLSRSYSEDGSLTFRPDGTDWVFSASVHFGRAHSRSHFRQSQAIPTTSFVYYHTSFPARGRQKTLYIPANPAAESIDADTVSLEKHLILDFEAGKDVGLGLLGRGSTSTIALGARFVQLNSALNMPQYQAVQGIHFSRFHSTGVVTTYAYYRHFPRYFSGHRELWRVPGGNGHSSHDFLGVGPSLSWKSSVPLAGNPDHSGEFLIDWGANAALLFGKQKNKVDRQVVSAYNCYTKKGPRGDLYVPTNHCSGFPKNYAHSGHAASQKRGTVQNFGGFAGLSYRLRDFKASFGYRVDFFLHAIDTGIAGQRAVTRGFQGPYASVSIGVGD